MTLMVKPWLGCGHYREIAHGSDGFTNRFYCAVIWATHPLTWLLAYAGVEGSVRLVGAAFTETNLGILPPFGGGQADWMITGKSREGRVGNKV